MKRCWVLAAAFALLEPSALAAPIGAGVEPVTVLAFQTDVRFDADLDLAAKTLTNALRQAVLDSAEYTLGGDGRTIYSAAYDAKCTLKVTLNKPVDERLFDDTCLRKVARHVEAKRYFWGFLSSEGGRTTARLHFWQEGLPDRVTSLPYDATARDRVAVRLYRKLVAPEKVGDLTVSGPAEGELVVDGASEGAYAPGLELTVPVGERAIEVRQGPRVVARTRAVVASGVQVEARLEPVAVSTAAAPERPGGEPPRLMVRPKASAWWWTLGAGAAAGLAGAGVFWGLRSAERSDLEAGCSGRACPAGQQGAVDRADLYGVLAAASLGVGVAAGAGLATYALTRKRAPWMVGGAAPVAGGLVVGVGGDF